MDITTLFNAMPGAVSQGLIWAIMGIGVYITFRILDVADLTVDGTLGLGGAVCIMCVTAGVPVWLAMVIAFAAGLLHGIVNGLPEQETVDFAIAASILKLMISGDQNLVTEAEVRGVMQKGSGAKLAR